MSGEDPSSYVYNGDISDVEFMKANRRGSTEIQLDNHNSSSNENRICGKKRGRPEKVIDIDNHTLWESLKESVGRNIRAICEGTKYDTRADTLRVRLMRQAKKLPLFLLHSLHSKSKYKSNNPGLVREAYLNSYKRFLELLQKHTLFSYNHWNAFDNPNMNPPDFINYCTLHFPESKVEQLFGDGAVALLLKHKKSTSLKGFLSLGRINKMLFQTLKLLKAATLDSLNDKAINIIDNFLKKEYAYFPK